MMIQFLRGDKQSLEASEYIPADGQPIYEKDTNLLKVGNGSSSYSALPYLGYSAGGMNWVEINGLYTPTASSDSSQVSTRAPDPSTDFYLKYYIPTSCAGALVYLGPYNIPHSYLAVIKNSHDNGLMYISFAGFYADGTSSLAIKESSWDQSNNIVDIHLFVSGVSNPQYILYLTDPTA